MSHDDGGSFSSDTDFSIEIVLLSRWFFFTSDTDNFQMIKKVGSFFKKVMTKRVRQKKKAHTSEECAKVPEIHLVTRFFFRIATSVG